ncbi:MAG TPA: helix-turn-helix domain-containing protein [Jatrophihabitans sp.]|nr:helix-turn-helix domain-containing protein [Jatrophihabitans sp.]
MASKQAAVSEPVSEPVATERPAEAERPMRADARRNYERLLQAGRAVLAERGSEASMEEIARRADVGVGTLYRHFPRRIDLVEAVYREDVDGLVELARTVNQQPGPWQGLVDWLAGFVKYGQSKRVFLTELHEAFEKNPDLALNSREKIAAAVATVLTRAQQAGLARTDIDAADLMQLIGGMCMARNASLAQNERLLQLVLDGVRTGG